MRSRRHGCAADGPAMYKPSEALRPIDVMYIRRAPPLA
jgi:hypothetical protein